MGKKKIKIIFLFTLVFLIIGYILYTSFSQIAENYYVKGCEATLEEDYLNAISYFTKAIQLNRRHADAYFERGIAYSFLNEHDAAIIDFDRAIRLNPKHDGAFTWRGLSYDSKGNYDEAIQNFDHALILNPNCITAREWRARTYEKKENFDLAINDLLAILHDHWDPSYIESRIEYIRNTQSRHRLSNLIPGTIEYSAEEHYQSGWYYYNKVRNRVRRESMQSAGTSLEEMINQIERILEELLSPDDTRDIPINDLMNMAISEWEEALRLAPNHDNAREALERAHIERGF